MRQAGAAARKERVEEEKEFVTKQAAAATTAETKKRLERIGACGPWLTVPPNLLDGTVLSAAEFRDNVRGRYGMMPLGLCAKCNGCGAKFTKEHAMSCKKGGLVGIRHDDVADAAGTLGTMALNSSHVSYKPLIFYDRGVTPGGRRRLRCCR